MKNSKEIGLSEVEGACYMMAFTFATCGFYFRIHFNDASYVQTDEE